MKTLKSLKEESRQFYTENAATYFAASFNKKMGGTQTISFEGEFLPTIKIDKREYYQGRGAKYNRASMHEHIEVMVTRANFEDRVNSRAKMFFERRKEEQKTAKAKRDFCTKHGLNHINYSYFSSSMGLFFEPSKKSAIETELSVDLSEFFAASGKTYFFAESKIGLLEFYHNHRQSYSFAFASEERKAEFYAKRESWISAPYAHLVGQTANENLYVC